MTKTKSTRWNKLCLPILVVSVLMVSNACSQSGQVRLSSPNGDLVLKVETVASGEVSVSGGQLAYSVTFKGKQLINRSALSLALQGQNPLGSNVQITKAETSEVDESYRLLFGKASSVHNDYNATRLYCQEPGEQGRKLIIEARAYDDAVAFRYVVPEQAALHDFRLTGERTEFRVAKDAITYSLVLPNFRSMYESEYIKLPISAFSNQGGVGSTVLIGLPVLMEVPGVAWMSITEADLRGYSSMYLVNPSRSWEGHWFVSTLAPQVEDTSVCVTGTLPLHSAWRIITVGEEPGRLIESNAMTNLSPPCALKDISWIQPGKSSWNWWSGSLGPDGKGTFTTATMKYYVDFAAQSGFEYMLIDAGWSMEGDVTKMNGTVDVPEVVRYAKAKNVRVWIWLHYRDAVRQMNQAFPLYAEWGVAGLKIDFIERDDQKGIEFYYTAAQKAAQYHLMLDIHGSTKPSGIGRTYPNLLSYEGVLGMEQSKAGCRDNPENQVTLPFTRMLAGPMDYTPGGFDNVTKTKFEPRMGQPMVMGTRAHDLAMYVVYETPFQMVSDHPDAYEGQTSFQFIKDVPVVWDETKVLNGLPGKYITIARRYGDQWFLGSMTNWASRQITIPLSFLGDGEYIAEIYSDASDANAFPKHVTIEKKTVNRTTSLTLDLASGGGCAIRFTLVQ